MKKTLFLAVTALLTLSSAQAQNTLRLMTYNIKNANGMDNVQNFQRVANVINNACPDAVAIQELDSMTNRSGKTYVLGEIAERTQMHAYFAPAIDYDGGKYGIGLLTKQTPIRIQTMALPGREEARALIMAEFEDYIYCCTHLSLTEEDRMTSLEMIKNFAASAKKPFFLAGDMNAEPQSDFIKGLQKDFQILSNPKVPTFPAPKPEETLDYIVTLKNNAKGFAAISSKVLDKLLAFDPSSKVACETLVTTGQVVLAGEVKTKAYVDLQRIAREVINRIGYTKSEYMFEGNSCGVFSAIHEQSADINRGVEREDPMNQGAGDQGMMFGYATNETENYMPLSLDLAHKLLMVLAEIRREGKVMTYLRPDAKSQVTIEYDDNGKPVRIDTIVVSTQHDEFVAPADASKEAQLKADEEMLAKIRKDVIEILMPRVIAEIHNEDVLALFNDRIVYHVNPTGKFVIGGPHGDTGLTGRKIIVDTYGGKGAHGGGAFSGKDPSKVDRSAAYAARHIAKNMVAAGVADEMLVQVSYAIGVARPINIYVNTYGRSNVKMTDGEIAQKIDELFDLRPKAIEERLKLRNPIYEETASYGHMGREPKVVTKTYESMYHEAKTMEVELFTWEKLDYVDKIKEAFGL